MKKLTIIMLCLSMIVLPAQCYAMQSDKIGHFVMGFVISASIGGEQGFWIGSLAGVGKESMDYMDRKHHSVEFLDFASTTLGSYTAWRLFPHKAKKQPTITIELYDGSKI